MLAVANCVCVCVRVLLTRPACDRKPPPLRLSPPTPETVRIQSRWRETPETPVNHTQGPIKSALFHNKVMERVEATLIPPVVPTESTQKPEKRRRWVRTRRIRAALVKAFTQTCGPAVVALYYSRSNWSDWCRTVYLLF